MGKYLRIINFFPKFISKKNYTDDDRNQLMQMLKTIKYAEDISMVVKYLNYCPDIFDGHTKYNKSLYKTYSRFIKNIKLDDSLKFFNYIETELYVKIVNELIHELNLELQTEETKLIVCNINYIMNIIYERDHFKVVIIDHLTKNDEELKILIMVLSLFTGYENRLYHLFHDIYKETEYEEVFLNMINDDIYNKIIK